MMPLLERIDETDVSFAVPGLMPVRAPAPLALLRTPVIESGDERCLGRSGGSTTALVGNVEAGSSTGSHLSGGATPIPPYRLAICTALL